MTKPAFASFLGTRDVIRITYIFIPMMVVTVWLESRRFKEEAVIIDF